ncbi:MAG: hypothetical protein GY867_04385 [bacterium]|nr:hypothetical protein [bacterium]
MKKTITATLIVGCIIWSLFGCDQGEKRVSLQFKFTPDTRLFYKEISKGSAKVTENDKVTSDRFAELEWTLEWYVRRLMEDSTAEIVETRTYRYMALEKDSSKSDTSAHTDDMTMYMKPNGQIVDLEPAQTRKGKLSYMKSYIEQGQPVFPSGELSQGYSWTQSTKVILPDGPIEASTTYEIKSFARERGYDCVVIEYDGNMAIPLEPSKEKSYELLAGVDRITSKGHLYFAYKEGMIVVQMERWLLDGERTYLSKESDTVSTHIQVEYDVDHWLAGVEKP